MKGFVPEEKSMLEKMWASGCAPWEVWNQQ